MTESYKAEFQTIDLILSSNAETRGVDAFALSLIKAERQIRRLVTHLVFQSPAFGPEHIEDLRNTLASNRRVYFEGFERGFNALYARSVEQLIGMHYERLHNRLSEAIEHRNKVFHGQLTLYSLKRKALLELVDDIRAWCEVLANAAQSDLGYDGFARDSFQKSNRQDLAERLKIRLNSIEAYAQFIRQYLERQPR